MVYLLRANFVAVCVLPVDQVCQDDLNNIFQVKGGESPPQESMI